MVARRRAKGSMADIGGGNHGDYHDGDVMRDKQTPPLMPEDMPEISEQVLGFVIDLARGETGTDAYKKNFPGSKDWKPSSVWCEASKLKNSPKVRQWLSAVLEANFQRGTLKLEEYVADLQGLAMRAEAAGNYGAAVQAKKTAGQASGLHTERVEVIDNRSDQDILDEIARLEKEAKDIGVMH